MSKEPVIGLYPINGCVLAEILQSHKNFNVKEGKYDSRTEGIVVRVPEGKTIALNYGKPIKSDEFNFLLGKRIHFEEFKEGSRIKRGGKIYSFIKVEDIRGYEIE